MQKIFNNLGFMDLKKIIKDLDINNLSGSVIAMLGAISITGIVQIIYCAIACLSFYLTFIHSKAKHKRRIIEMDLNNELLRQQIEKNKIKDER